MAIPKQLRKGVDCPAISASEEQERIAVLQATVENYLPGFAKGVADAVRQNGGPETTVFLHQDAFAAGYDDDEYTLLGMAVKFAGLHGIGVTITGRNHESF
jgi:hypothetical protein